MKITVVLCDPRRMREQGFSYVSVGRSPVTALRAARSKAAAGD
jgi:predicted transcriptional regulator